MLTLQLRSAYFSFNSLLFLHHTLFTEAFFPSFFLLSILFLFPLIILPSKIYTLQNVVLRSHSHYVFPNLSLTHPLFILSRIPFLSPFTVLFHVISFHLPLRLLIISNLYEYCYFTQKYPFLLHLYNLDI